LILNAEDTSTTKDTLLIKHNIIHLLQISVLTLSATVVGAQEVDFSVYWQYSAYGTEIGEAGISDYDIDGDGINELIFTSKTRGQSHNNLWSIQAYDVDRDDYKIIRQLGPYTSGLGRLILYSTESTGAHVVVGRRDGIIEIWQLDGFSQVDEFSLDSVVEDIVYADSNNDGIAELVFLTSKSIFWVDASTFEILDSEPNQSSAKIIAVANVDEDSAKEIVLDSGLVLEKTSGPTLINWDSNGLFSDHSGFGDQILLQDIDNDGIAEVITAQRFGEISAVSVIDQNVIWSFDPEAEINALSAFDYDGDGTKELVFGEGQHGNLVVLNMETREELYRVFNPTSGFSSIHFARIHADGEPRLIWGGGYNTSAPDFLHIANTSSGIEWSSPAIERPFKAFDVADVDQDGALEYLFSSTGYWHLNSHGTAQLELGLMGVVSGSPPSLEWLSSSSTWAEFPWASSHDIVVADVDGDGVPEIVLGGEVDGVGTIHIIDAQTKVIKRTVWLDESSPIYKLAVADVDGDGTAEIVAAAGKRSTAVDFVYAYFVDGYSGEVKWRSPDLFGTKGGPSLNLFGDSKDLKIANIDSDSALEVIIAFGDVVVIDAVSRSMERAKVSFHDNEKTAGLAILDIDQDGLDEVFFATGFGELQQLDVDTMSAHFVADLCPVAFLLQGVEHIENGWIAYSCMAIDQYYGPDQYRPRDSLNVMNVYSRETVWSTDVNAMGETGWDTIKTWSDQNSWYLALGTYQDVTVFRHEGLHLPQEGSKGFSYVPSKNSDKEGSDNNGGSGSSGSSEGDGGGGGALTPVTIFYLIILFFMRSTSYSRLLQVCSNRNARRTTRKSLNKKG